MDEKMQVDSENSALSSSSLLASNVTSSSPRPRHPLNQNDLTLDSSDLLNSDAPEEELDYNDLDDNSHHPTNPDCETTFNAASSSLLNDPLPIRPFACQCVPDTLIDDAVPKENPNVIYDKDIHRQIFQTPNEIPFWINPAKNVVHERRTVHPPHPAYVSFSTHAQAQFNQ